MMPVRVPARSCDSADTDSLRSELSNDLAPRTCDQSVVDVDVQILINETDCSIRHQVMSTAGMLAGRSPGLINCIGKPI